MLPQDGVTVCVNRSDCHAGCVAVVKVYGVVEESFGKKARMNREVPRRCGWPLGKFRFAVVTQAFLFFDVQVADGAFGLAVQFGVVLWFHYSLLFSS